MTNMTTQRLRDIQKQGEQFPKKNVDTGMGYERVLAVLEGVDDNYKTSLWKPIINKIE